jgi:hypothetical protein
MGTLALKKKLGLGRSLFSTMNTGSGGGVAPAAPRMTFGATFGGTGDGLVAPGGGVGNGPNNALQLLQTDFKGKLQPTVAPFLGKSGTRIKTTNGAQYAWVAPYAIDALAAQMPNLWLHMSSGHNDGLMNVDPASSQQMQDWKDAVSYAYSKFTAYAAVNDYFAVGGTFGSTVAGESTWRATVWAAQKAYVQAMTATDYRVRFIDISTLVPPESYSVDTSSNYTHVDERAARALNDLILAALADVLPTQTLDDVVAAIIAGTYPLMGTANLDTNSAMTGTGGAVSGTGLSIGGDGFLPTAKTITLTMSGLTCVATRIDKGNGRYKVRVTFDGTASSAGKIMWGDTSNIARTASPGRYFRHGCRVKLTKGFRNFGGEAGTMGAFAGGASSLANNALVGANTSQGLDTILWANEQPTYGNDTIYSTARKWAVYWATGEVFVAANDYIEFEEPFTYEVSERSRVPAAFIGTLVDASNSDSAVYFNTNYRPRVTGAISQAAGGTLRWETGYTLPRGLLNTDFTAKRAYKGTSANTAVGSGTLIATVTTTAWTTTIAAAAVTTGDIIWGEIDILCPITAQTRTVRCRLNGAVTAT